MIELHRWYDITLEEETHSQSFFFPVEICCSDFESITLSGCLFVINYDMRDNVGHLMNVKYTQRFMLGNNFDNIFEKPMEPEHIRWIISEENQISKLSLKKFNIDID